MKDESISYLDALKEIKRLKEVLNKIRAEIEKHAKINQNVNTDRAKALCWCLDVIDKYKAESENKRKMTDPDKYLIAVYDAENNECFLIYESIISPQLNTQLYFPHLGLYNVEKIVYHISDDHSKSEYEELMFIDIMVLKVNKEEK